VIERYTKEEMGKIWTEFNEWDTMKQVEILASEAQSELGLVPKDAVRDIREKAKFSVDRIHEIEAETHHDIAAFVSTLSENVGESGKYIHLGLTSTDVKDTALGYMLKQASDILIKDLEAFRDVLRRRAVEFKHTPMIGRTHGIHAEATTFGLKLVVWLAETERNIERMKRAKETIAVGKISGAVGTYADIDPFVEKYVCEKLGIAPAPISTQTLQRDRHAEFVTTLAVIASSIDKFATEIRHLQRTEVREAEEYFSPKQKGSSIMPHKRNPITCERMCGLARVIRGNAQAALEDVALWHERDISHSSVERVILPDSTIALDYMLQTFTRVIDRLFVYPEKMMKDLNLTGGLIYSPILLNTLVEKGAVREQAYRWVQRNAMKRWLEGEDFLENLKKDEDIAKYMTNADIESCFDVNKMLRHVDEIFARFGL
jgi:adenylosuccinate lyase